MPVNPHLARWVFASLTSYLKSVAEDNNVAAIIEGVDERTPAYMQARDRVEIRITGPHVQEISHNYFRVWVDSNVLITSDPGGANINKHTFLTICGLYQHAMDQVISVIRAGNGPDDDGEPIGCLRPRSGPNDVVRVLHFGQIERTDRTRQSAVDARYVMYLST